MLIATPSRAHKKVIHPAPDPGDLQWDLEKDLPFLAQLAQSCVTGLGHVRIHMQKERTNIVLVPTSPLLFFPP